MKSVERPPIWASRPLQTPLISAVRSRCFRYRSTFGRRRKRSWLSSVLRKGCVPGSSFKIRDQQIAAELVNYKSRMVPFMPGERTADKNALFFFAIFSTMIGAVEIARLLPDRAMRRKSADSTREFLLQLLISANQGRPYQSIDPRTTMDPAVRIHGQCW